MNRRGTEPYARWCGRSAGAIPPPTRCGGQTERLSEYIEGMFFPARVDGLMKANRIWGATGDLRFAVPAMAAAEFR